MSRPLPILIGEITVDFVMPARGTSAKVRLGGVVHAARGLWAIGQPYAVGAYCPKYLIEQTQEYLSKHGCEQFFLLGEVTGAPNVIAIADVKEVGHQGYEDILRDDRSIVSHEVQAELRQFQPFIVFTGRYDLQNLLTQLDPDVQITIDAAYDIEGEQVLRSLTNKVDTLVISTSSPLFMSLASEEIAPLLSLAKKAKAKYLLLKENRGGSRLFDLLTDKIEHVGANLGRTANSVGVGDVFTAVYAASEEKPSDAVWRGMQVATAYSQTTWPDDFRRDAGRALKVPVQTVRSLGGVCLPWHARPKLQIYLAAPDFSYKNHREIEAVVKALEYHNFRVRRPVKENGEAAPDGPIAILQELYLKDVQLLRECEAVFAVPLERDPGTLVEVGMAIEMGKPVVTFDPHNENANTMVISGSDCYSHDLDLCVNGIFEALSNIHRKLNAYG